MSEVIIRALRRTLIGALILGVFVVLGVNTPAAHAAPGINQQLNFQGRLLTASGATVADGYYNMQFKIYQDGTGTVAGNPSGTLKWTESWLNTAGNGVQVKNGYMSVQLGSITSLSAVDWNQDTLWLSINVGNTNVSCTPFTSCAGDGEMLPMKRLASTPYAFNAGQLGGLTSAQFLQLAQGVQTEAGTNSTSIAINKTGTGGNFLNLQASAVDVFTIANTGDITFGSNIDHAISVATAPAATAGKGLTISAGTAGTGGSALTGGTLVLQGGNGGGTAGNGGDVTLDAGAAASGGVGGTINIGTTNASAVNIGQSTTLAAGKSLTITGSGTRPSSPTEGMVYYDTTTKQLLTYSNGKWQSDRSTSTKIVAANNSSQALKDSADYVATGTSDQTTINTALTAAAGGKVYLTEGTYNTDDKIQIPNNTTLAGSGRNTLIQLGNLAGASKNMIENTDQGGTTGEGVVVRDLRIDGNSSVNTTGTIYGIYMNNLNGSSGASARSGATIANVWVMNMRSDGIRFNASPNSNITNNTVQGGLSNGIYLSSSNRVEVSNNTVQGTTGGGIWLAGAINVTVTSNVLIANGTSGISLNGTSSNNTISSNNLANNGGSGANNSITLSNVSNNQIIGNSINDNAGTGAAIGIDSASANNYLADNVFSGTGATSISDASTTTVYSNQSRAATGGQSTNRTANDTQAFAVQNAGGSNIFAVDTTNSQVVLGNSTTAGKLNISDGSSNTGTIVVGPLSGNYTYTIPTTTSDDTFCLVTLNNCAANSALFIQNQNSAVQTSSNFWISGTGRADTSLLTPTVDTATGVALNIGTTSATSVSIGKAATTTTVHGNLGVTLNATTGTTITCQNASGYLSICDSSVLTPSAANFIQNGTSVQTGANFWIDGFGKVAGGVQTGSVDTIGAAGSLNIGTSNAGSLTIGKTGVTTTIQGNIGVTLNATTGTTQVCRNATGLLSSCDAAYLAPTATNFIQNQATTPGTAQTANFNITGTGIAGTLQAANVVGTTFDTATGVALNIGASGTPTTTAINLNQSATLAAGKSLTLTGGNSASRPGSPTEGMLYYDTDTHQLLQWNGTKWVSDRSTATKIVGTSASGGASSAIASIAPDGADYVNTSTTSAQTVINSALSSISTNGGTIYLMEGTYIIDGSISIPNNVTLSGAGSGTIIKLKNGINADINAIVATDTATGTGVVVSNLRIEGNKANQTAGIQNGIYFNNMGGGNGSTARQGAKLTDLWISSMRSYGIMLENSSNGIISSNNINASNFALYLKTDLNMTITGNTIQGNTRGIYTEPMYRSTVSANTIEGNQYGIYLTSNGSDNIVSGNSINRNSVAGLQISTVSNTAVTGNRFMDNGGATTNESILLNSTSTNNTITGNTITDASATTNNYAIDINDSASTGNYLGNNTLGTGSINDAATASSTYGGQINGSGNYTVQPASGTVELMKNTNVTGTLSASTSVLSPNIDRASAGTLTIGTNGTNTTALTIGSSGITTTIQGNTGVTLNATTGTTMVCRNASGVLSTCDAGYLAPTATNFIQNGSTQQASSNFNISGTGQATSFQAATSVLTPLLDAATASTVLNIGTTNASAINLNQSAVLAAGKSLTLTGGNTASRPGSPTDGMMYYDSTTDQLLVYNTTLAKWVADKSSAILVAASNSSEGDKAAADYIATGTNDQTQINNALTSADPAGSGRKTGKVILFAGTYTIGGTISVPNNTTLAGSGAGTVITIPNSVNASFTAITNTTNGGNGTGVVIQDLKLDGNKANQSIGSYGMYGIKFDGMGSGTLTGGKIQNVWVTNWYGNGVTSWTYAGIYISTGSRNTITNVVAQSNTNNGIAITGTYTNLTGSDFTGNNYGIHLSSNNNTITDNTASGNTANGIYLENASQNTVTGNVATGNTTTNIYLTGSSSNTISGNQALGSSSNDGVGLSSSSTYNTISSNIIQANSTGGVSIASTSTNNTITGNKIHNNGGNNNKGVYFSNSNNNTITNNVISDLTTTASNNPINIDSSSANTYLSNNYFSSTAANGTIADASTTTVYVNQPKAEGGGQQTNRTLNDTAAFAFQKADGTNVLTVDTTNSKVLVAGSLDTTTATTLSIGTSTATALTIGSSGITTTIQGNTGVTLNATTGTTMICRNASGVLATCDAGYLAPTATNFIQNGSTQQASSNFNISGTGQATTFQAATSVLTPLLDAATASTVLNIGTTNASAINLNQSAVLAAGKSLTLTGGNTASRPASPSEGMTYYDTTTKQLIVYSNGKWQADRTTTTKIVAASNASQAEKDGADYVATGTSDQSTINTALTAAAGGRVYLTEGTFTTDDVISIPNDTTLAGAGRGTLIKFADIHGQTKNMITNSDTTATSKGVTVRDLQLDGNWSGVNTTGTIHGIAFISLGGGSGSTARQGPTILNTWVVNFLSYGIYLNNSPNGVVSGNNVQAGGGNGIYLSSSNRVSVTSNISQGNNGSGIVLSGDVVDIINSNTFATNGTAGIYVNGGSNNNTISGNNLYNNGGGTTNNAIYFPGSANGDNNTITSNTINDTSGTTSNYAINIVDNTSNNNYLADNVFTSTAGTSTINDPAGTNTVYANQSRAEAGGQLTNRTANDAQAFAVQNASGTNIFAVDTSASKVLVSGTLDTTTATTLNIGTATASAISIGSGSITTTIAGNTGVTLNGTTGTTMVCRNASGLLSSCDATYLTPTATNFIQNQNASAQTTANFWISGSGQAATLTAGTVTASTNLVTPSIDTASAVALTLGGTTANSVDIGKSAGTVNLKANSTLVGTSGSTITIQGAAQSTANTAGNQFTLKGSTGNGSGAGGQLTIQGGDGGATSGANGGNVYISGGAGTGTGSAGLVVFTTPTFSTVTNDANCFTGGSPVAASCTIAAASVNGSSAILVGFTVDGQTATLPNPTITTAGRVIYVTASGTTSDFTLSVNGGGQGNLISMRKNTTATMIWNGSAWTAAGASSSTTLQASYDNTLQSAGGAELVVSKTTATNGLTIRDSTTNSVNGALLTVQSSSAANLFSVNSDVTEYATDPGAEVYGASTTTFPANTWATLASPTSTVSRYTTAGDNIATGQGSVSVVTPATTNAGVMNRLTTTLTPNMTYNVSFSARLSSGTFTDMSVYYSINGSAQSVVCATGQTARTSIWTKINCSFQAPSSGITSTNSILIQQATGVARTFYVDNISVTIAADYNYATDGDVDDNTNFATNWVTAGLGTVNVTRNTSDGFNASSSATAAITSGAANAGLRNKLSINPLTDTLYRVSAYAKLSTGSFTDFKVRYSPNGGTNYVDCVDYNTQTITTSGWTQVTCYIKTATTTVSSPYVYFVETASATRTYSVDAFSMTLASNTTANVQIGSGSNGGPTTLFTVDKGASAPIAANNDALLGSMYYDTSLGKLQCYEADGWGACGSSPDNIVTISPEYTNAVMHGTGIGTMTSDLCSSTLNINDGTSGQSTICGSNETYNFYKWTSPQATAQTYSIYVTYQLPATFKEFASGAASIMGRTDSASSTVQYQIYRSNTTSGMSACGAAVTVSTGVQTSWQPGQATGASDPSTCGFAAGDSIVFKISMTSSSNANAYVGNLGFTFSNR